MRIGIVAGEASGDLLGAGLIGAIQKRFPDATFEGVGGDKMKALGFDSFFPLERLAVMGLVEPLKRLPELLRMRRQLKRHFVQNPPDVFIGIDSPDFNLNLEKHIKRAGIKTVHYVSPSVWAWRQGRIKTIKSCVDLMLTLFPHEERFYHEHQVPVICVGHMLADSIPLNPQTVSAKRSLNLEKSGKRYIALLPGSRSTEVKQLWPCFLQVAQQLCNELPDLEFIVACASDSRKAEILSELEKYNHLPIQVYDGRAQDVMLASDVVLMASGTASLEAMLLKKPMVICYRLAALSYFLLSRLVKVKYIGLPNLLAGRQVVPEYIQNQASPDNLAQALRFYLQQPGEMRLLSEEFLKLHMLLKRNAAESAAAAILKLVSD